MIKKISIEPFSNLSSHTINMNYWLHIITNSAGNIIIEINGQSLNIAKNRFLLVDENKSLTVKTGDPNNLTILSIKECDKYKNKHIHLLHKITQYRKTVSIDTSEKISKNIISIIDGFKYYENLECNSSITNILETMISEISLIIWNELSISDSLKDDIKWNYLGTFYKLLEEQFDKTRSVTFYSNQINISTKKLNNICKEIVNKKVKEIIDDRVLSEIDYYLKNSNLSMIDIAYKLGFYETTNLVKFFKRYRNETPGKYRQKIS